MSASTTIFIGSDGDLELTGLIDTITETYQNTATVTGQLYDLDNNAVGASIDLTYVAASNGHYRGSVPATLTTTLTRDEEYEFRVVAIVSGGHQRTFALRVIAGYGDE